MCVCAKLYHSLRFMNLDGYEYKLELNWCVEPYNDEAFILVYQQKQLQKIILLCIGIHVLNVCTKPDNKTNCLAFDS